MLLHGSSFKIATCLHVIIELLDSWPYFRCPSELRNCFHVSGLLKIAQGLPKMSLLTARKC